MVEQVHGLYYRNLRVVKLVVGLYDGSPMMVELKVGFHHRCPSSDHEIS